MVKETTAESNIRCNECGAYETSCYVCKHFFDTEEVIICDDVHYDGKATGEHFCLKCWKKT